MNRTLAISSLLVAPAIIVACSGKSTPPPVTVSVGPQDAGDADAGVATAAPPPPPEAGAPTAPPFFTDAGAAPSTAMPDQAADLAIDALLATAATKNAPKMTETGTVGRQTMAENDHLSFMVNLEPNKCYTFIGTSLPGMVSEIGLTLYAPPFYTVPAGASDPKDKAVAMIAPGSKAMCPLAPITVPYKVDAVAKKGAGRVVVKVYSRSK